MRGGENDRGTDPASCQTQTKLLTAYDEYDDSWRRLGAPPAEQLCQHIVGYVVPCIRPAKSENRVEIAGV